LTTTPPEPNDAQPNPAPDAPQQPVEQPAPAYAAAPAPGYAAAPPVPPAAGGPGVPPYQPYQAPAPSSGTTNVLAIVAFVASFFVNIVGIVCGHIALSQIKRTGEKGRGFALAGLIIGYVSVAITIVSIVFVIIASVASGLAVANAVRNLPTDLPSDSSSDAALTVDCARLDAAASSLIPVLNDQIPNLATDPTTAQAQIVAAFDAFTASTSDLSDPDLASEVDAFNADVETLKADLNTYIATPEADRDSSLLESDVSTISDQFDTLGSYCG
jgi:hypothetical protein